MVGRGREKGGGVPPDARRVVGERPRRVGRLEAAIRGEHVVLVVVRAQEDLARGAVAAGVARRARRGGLGDRRDEGQGEGGAERRRGAAREVHVVWIGGVQHLLEKTDAYSSPGLQQGASGVQVGGLISRVKRHGLARA